MWAGGWGAETHCAWNRRWLYEHEISDKINVWDAGRTGIAIWRRASLSGGTALVKLRRGIESGRGGEGDGGARDCAGGVTGVRDAEWE